MRRGSRKTDQRHHSRSREIDKHQHRRCCEMDERNPQVNSTVKDSSECQKKHGYERQEIRGRQCSCEDLSGPSLTRYGTCGGKCKAAYANQEQCTRYCQENRWDDFEPLLQNLVIDALRRT